MSSCTKHSQLWKDLIKSFPLLMPCNVTWSYCGNADVFMSSIFALSSWKRVAHLTIKMPLSLFDPPLLPLVSWWVSLSVEFLCSNWITVQNRLSLSSVRASYWQGYSWWLIHRIMNQQTWNADYHLICCIALSPSYSSPCPLCLFVQQDKAELRSVSPETETFHKEVAHAAHLAREIHLNRR